MEQPKILILTVSEKPFWVMVTGEKTDEFRKDKESKTGKYWMRSRLYNQNILRTPTMPDGVKKDYELVKFTLGYGTYKPYFFTEFKGFDVAETKQTIRYSNGLEVVVEVGDFIIHLGDVLETGNLNL